MPYKLILQHRIESTMYQTTMHKIEVSAECKKKMQQIGLKFLHFFVPFFFQIYDLELKLKC